MNQCVIVFVTGKCSGWLVEGNKFRFNSLTLKSDQDRISPRNCQYNINHKSDENKKNVN